MSPERGVPTPRLINAATRWGENSPEGAVITPEIGAEHPRAHPSPAGARTVHLCVSCCEPPLRNPMVRKKKLSPSGAKDDDGEYHNVHVNLHEDELAVAGMEIGDEVFVRVRDSKIIIQKADPDEVEHEF